MNQVDYLKRLHEGLGNKPVPAQATEHIQAAIDILEKEILHPAGQETFTQGVLNELFGAMSEVI